MKDSVVYISKDVMGGTPVFAGTRVPIQTLIDFLTAGDTIDDFIDGFPTVTREQAVRVLEHFKSTLNVSYREYARLTAKKGSLNELLLSAPIYGSELDLSRNKEVF